MSTLIENKDYLNDLNNYSKIGFINYNKLKNKTILITGATGLIGRYFVDLIMLLNKKRNLNIKIIAICRNTDTAREYFNYDTKLLELISHNVIEKISYNGNIDYIVHCASNTSPSQYVNDPIGTINTNVLGTKNLLDLSISKNAKKFVLVSSFEVYGHVSNVKKIGEHDYGTIDNTILRSCYPESKRLSESLCIAYSNQKESNTSIVRLSRVFGPTMNVNSSISLTQFLKAGLNNEDIVLKSDGEQLYSYNYVGDAVSAIIKVMIDGENAEAYNVSDEKFDGKLKEFAKNVADYTSSSLIFDIPSESESKGFSNSVMTILDSDKIKSMGWYAISNLRDRIKYTLDILRESHKE